MIKNQLKKIGNTLRLSEQEIKVVLTIGALLIFGLFIKYVSSPSNEKVKKYNYSAIDEHFNSITIESKSNQKIMEKKVDSEQELLDFSENKKESRVIKSSNFNQTKININTAEINELIKLPGIGKKTAKQIIDYRLKFGNFVNINELLDVKGIGPKKLNKIKSIIIID